MKHGKHKKSNFVEKTVLISAVLLAALVFFSVAAIKTWPQRTVEKIYRLIDDEKYLQAEELIEKYEYNQNTELIEAKEDCSYNIALNALTEGNTEEAQYRLKNLDNFMNVLELLQECNYLDAESMMTEGKYEEAYALFAVLLDYKDSPERMQEARYEIAYSSYNEGDIAKALELLISLEDYKDAQDVADDIAMEVTGAETVAQAYQILEGLNAIEMQKTAELTEQRKRLSFGVLAVGANHTVGLMSDGKVASTGLNDDGQCNAEEWSDIIAIDAGAYHTVGLKEDGTVVAAGRNDEAQCEVDKWENVVQIAAGAYDTYGLLEDGTVVSTGFLHSEIFSTLSNVKEIGAGSYAAVCISEDGIIFASHPSMIISDLGAISADVSTGFIVALMPEGKTVSSDENIPEWENIIAICAGSNMIMGINNEGKVETYFFDKRDEFSLDKYRDVRAIAGGSSHSALLLGDGSVCVFGSNEYGECNVGDWELLVKD